MSSSASQNVTEAEGGRFSPRLTFTLVGSLRTYHLVFHYPLLGSFVPIIPDRIFLRSSVAFVALIIGFHLVARKTCCARRAPSSESLPTHYHDCPHRHVYPPTARGKIAYPVASVYRKCPECLRIARKNSSSGSFRASRESLVSPPPPYAAQSPTAMSRGSPTSFHCHSGSLASLEVGRHAAASTLPDHAPLASSSPALPPPAYYASRGPVAGPIRHYQRS